VRDLIGRESEPYRHSYATYSQVLRRVCANSLLSIQALRGFYLTVIILMMTQRTRDTGYPVHLSILG